jgi:hypothetical protein
MPKRLITTSIRKVSAILLLFSTVLFACHNNIDKNKTIAKQSGQVFNPADSTYLVDEQQSNETVYPFARPATFVSTTLYANADTLSAVKTVIPPFTHFKILSSQEITREDTLNDIPNNGPYIRSSLIVYHNVKLTDGTEGFIVNDNIANFTFKDTQGRYLYMVGAYTTKDKDFNDFVRFVKYDINAKKVIETLTHRGFPGAIMEVNEVKNLPLKNIDFCLHVNGHGDYCGGVQSALILVDTPNGMAFLPQSDVFLDDGGGIDATTVYIPAVNGKGKTLLYGNADTRGIDTIAYPKNIKYPLSETMIMETEDGQEYRDDNNDPILLKNGNVKMHHHSKTTTYYHWDGKAAKQFFKKKVAIK